MARILKSIEIKASPPEIWPLISWDKVPTWMRIIKKAEYSSQEREGVGCVAHVCGEAGGVNSEWDAETTEWTEYSRTAWRSTSGTFTGFGSMTLLPSENGTVATFMMDYELPHSILGKIVNKLRVYRALEKGVTIGLEKLKATIESPENKI
jgi:uncharacterized membrane protein